MKALIFTYCKDCALRNTGDCPISVWAIDWNGENGSYITETDDYFYCGAGVPRRKKGERYDTEKLHRPYVRGPKGKAQYRHSKPSGMRNRRGNNRHNTPRCSWKRA